MFKHLRNRITTYALAIMPELSRTPAKMGEQKKTLSWKIKRNHVWRIKAEIDTLRLAIAAAENIVRPDRRPLNAIYREIEENSEVITQTRVAIFTIKRAPFILLNAKNKEDREAKKRFQYSWFFDLIEFFIKTEFWGFKVVEFDPYKDAKGNFKLLWEIPVDNVRPEFGEIILNPADVTGIDIYDSKSYPFLLPMGKVWDLGLFKGVATPAIRMKYSDTDWSQFSEKFGMPIMAIHTASQDAKEIDAKEEMAKNLGSNGFVILDDTDKVEFMNANSGSGNAHAVFSERINKAENQIAKIINGQSSTSDEKAHVGSAEVHERMLNNFTYARMMNLQFFINEELIPFLNRHGYGLEGYTFQFIELLEKEKSGAAPTSTDNNKQGASIEKKKPNPKLAYRHSDQCCADIMPLTNTKGNIKLSLDLTSLMEKIVTDVYTEQIKAGNINADLWKQNVEQVIKAMEEGYGKNYIDTKYTDPDRQVMAQLRYNAMVFTAFKNHKNIAEMVNVLRDNKGNIRPFSEFKPLALDINKNYNVHWLAAEYDAAIGAARMAANWHHIKDNSATDDPLLQYITVGDERVRQAHRKLDGVTLPMSHQFWQTFYPPNGWRCRCDVIEVFDEPIKNLEEAPSDEEVGADFRFNPGITNELFSQEHPYYANISQKEYQSIVRQLHKLIYDATDEKEYEKIMFDEQSGAAVIMSKQHGKNEIEINKKIAKKVAIIEKSFIELLPNDNKTSLADSSINGVYCEFKTTVGTATSVQTRLREGKEQSNIILLDLPDAYNREDVWNGTRAACRNDKDNKIKEVWFLHKEKITKKTRKEIDANNSNGI